MRRLHLTFSVIILLLFCKTATSQTRLSPSFADAGVARFHLADYNTAVDVKVLSGDSILLLTNISVDSTVAQSDVAVLRLLPGGKLDSAFGNKGVARFDFENIDYSVSTKMEVLLDGSILILGSGYSPINSAYQPVCIKKLFADGTVDSSFGRNGTLNIQFGSIQEFPRVLKRESDGKVLIGGYCIDSLYTHGDVPVIARIDEFGKLDSTFGENGKLYLHFPNELIQASRHTTGGYLNDLLELKDGTWLASGGYSNGNNLMGYITHIVDGKIDTTFLNAGYMAIDFTPYYSSQIIRMGMTDSNTVWFGASAAKSHGKDFCVGKLDLSNDSFSTSSINFNDNEDVLTDMVMSKDGNPVFIGQSTEALNNASWYQSDYFSIAYQDAVAFPQNTSKATFNLGNGLQSGANAAALLSDGRLLCFGFNYTPKNKTDLTLAAFDLSLISAITTLDKTNDLISIFPNPSNGIFTINTGMMDKSYTVEIMDATGSVVVKNIVQKGDNKLNASFLLEGIYWLKITTEAGKQLSKSIIKLN